MEKILEIKNVTKRFGNKTVIDNISLDIKAGEVYGFLGPNGAGKTTIIKMIMGLLKITEGEIFVCGHNVVKDYEQAAENFGGIIENPEMYADLKGITNMKVFSDFYPNVTDEKINKIIEVVGLTDRINDPIKKYSLGMRQRLGLAQALVHDPKLLVLDEPTNGLDPLGIKELRDILRKLAKEKNVAVLVSSHLLSEMELMCDKVCIIDKGKIVEIKELDQNNENKNEEEINKNISVYVYEVDNNDELLKIMAINNIEGKKNSDNNIEIITTKENIAKLNKEIIAKNINIYTITRIKKSLEDIFMEATNKKGANK